MLWTLLHTSLAFAAVDMRFLSATRRSMSSGGSENLGIVFMILVIVLILIGGSYAYKNATYLGYLSKYYLKRMPQARKDSLLGVILKGRFVLEIFMLNGKRFEFLCSGRMFDVGEDGIKIDILAAKKIKKEYLKKMLNIYFTPITIAGQKYNCFRGYIENIDRRRVVVRSHIFFDYQSRRRDFRYQVENQRYVRTRMWMLTPTNGFNAAHMLRPALEVNIGEKVPNVRAPEVLDISANGLGIGLSPSWKHEEYKRGADVVLHLMVYNETTKKYRAVWVAGVVQNKFSRKGTIVLGIQFSHIGKTQDSEGKQIAWSPIDPDHGIVGFAALLASLS